MTHKTICHKSLKLIQRRESNMYSGNLHENERGRFGEISMPDLWQKLPSPTSFAATHARRVHWNSTEVSLRNVPIKVPSKISSRSSFELKAWNHNATHTNAS